LGDGGQLLWMVLGVVVVHGWTNGLVALLLRLAAVMGSSAIRQRDGVYVRQVAVGAFVDGGLWSENVAFVEVICGGHPIWVELGNNVRCREACRCGLGAWSLI